MNRWAWMLGLVGGLAACGGGAGDAGDPVGGVTDNVAPLGSVGVVEGGLYSDILVTGATVYGCTAEHGMRIASLDEAGTIQSTVEQVAFENSEGCRSLALSPGGAMYVAGETIGGGSWVARLTGDGTGTVASRVTIADGLVETISANDTHVAVALGNKGLLLLGLTDGELAQVGSLTDGFERALGAAFWGADRVVVADGLAGLAIVDTTDPATPTLESHIDTRGTARRVAIDGSTAYVADVGGGISRADLDAGIVNGSWDTHGSSVDLAIGAGDLLAVANLEDVAILDVSGASLTLLATEVLGASSSSAGRTVAVDTRESLVVAAEWAGLWALDYNAAAASPDIHLSRTTVNLGKVGLKKSQGIIIQNLGNAELTIDSVTVNHADFTAILDQDRLAPGAKTLLEVIFEPAEDGPVSAELLLATNDPDETTLLIPLAANQPGGIQVGADFEGAGDLKYSQYETGNEVNVSGEHSGKVVILAYFGTS